MTEPMDAEIYQPVTRKFVETEPVALFDYKYNAEPGTPLAHKDWSTTQLEKISRKHGRSQEETLTKSQFLWGDGDGGFYGSRNWKGLPSEEPYVKFDWSGFKFLRAQGLKEDTNGKNGFDERAAINRIMKASAFVRSLGLPTERLVSVRKVKNILHDGKMIPVADWKQKMIDKGYKHDTKGVHVGQEDLENFLESVDFYVLEREVQTAERLVDLIRLNFAAGSDRNIVTEDISFKIAKSDPGDDDFEIVFLNQDVVKASGEKFISAMDRIFKWVNQYENRRQSRLESLGIPQAVPLEVSHFDVKDPKSMVNYFTKYIPTNMGISLGTLHHAGVYHEYATEHNWSAVGSLYDLDSLKGKPLSANDDPISAENIKRDVVRSMQSINSIFGLDITKEVIADGEKSAKYEGYLSQIGTDNDTMRTDALSQFLAAYAVCSADVPESDPSQAIQRMVDIVGDGYILAEDGYQFIQVNISEEVKFKAQSCYAEILRKRQEKAR